MANTIRFFLLFLVITSCSRSVTRIDPGQQIDLSGRWNDSDSRQISQKMINDLLTSERFKEYSKALGKKPTIIVGLVNNKTSEHIDADNYIKKIELAIYNSGAICFTCPASSMNARAC